jgi:hypothetical protein
MGVVSNVVGSDVIRSDVVGSDHMGSGHVKDNNESVLSGLFGIIDIMVLVSNHWNIFKFSDIDPNISTFFRSRTEINFFGDEVLDNLGAS